LTAETLKRCLPLKASFHPKLKEKVWSVFGKMQNKTPEIQVLIRMLCQDHSGAQVRLVVVSAT
jgi:hypothetical protein